MGHLIFLLAVGLTAISRVVVNAGAADVEISYMTPRKGSLFGETRVTIYGTGFAENQFNFGDDSHVGNRVEMFSDTRVYPCEVHKDGTTETQIMCYTTAMPDDYYTIRVWVDGEEVPENKHCRSNKGYCVFRPQWGHTPRIYSMTPAAGPPRSVVSMRGVIITDLFEQNVAKATNGRTEEFKRVYNNGQLCELRVEDTDELYGLALDGENSYYGEVSCRTGGTYVGNQNASFIVSGYYGRSRPEKNVLKPTGQNTLAMYQTYAQIYNVTPEVGGVVGGTHLTINGRYFDETDAPAEVYIGGEPCEVIDLTDDKIVCLTPAEVSSMDAYPGNRGWTMDVFNSSGITSMEMSEIVNLTDPDYTLHLDSSYYRRAGGDERFVARLRGYFVPPKTSDYQFWVKADDANQLYLSTSMDPEDMTLIAETPAYANSYTKYGSQKSAKIPLEEGQRYYMEATFKNIAGWSAFHAKAVMLETTFTNAQSAHITDEEQVISITSQHADEIQFLTFENWTTQASVPEVQTVQVSSDFPDDALYRLGLYGAFTEQLSVQSSASDVQDALNDLVTLPDGVSVSSSAGVNGSTYTVTFQGDSGGFPLLEVSVDASVAIEVTDTVTRTVGGVPSLSSVKLLHEGIPSSPISYDSLDTTTVEAAVTEINSVRCPADFLNPSGQKYFQDYENQREDFPGKYGTITKETAPFCGRYSSKNPEKIFDDNYRSVMIESYNKLCFAYKGNPKSYIKIYYTFNTDEENNINRNKDFEIGLTEHKEWGYVCVNMLSLIQGVLSDASFIRVTDVKIYRNSGDLYVDTVYLGAREPITDFEGISDYKRLIPTRWILDEFTVTGDKYSGFEITITTLHCKDQLGAIGIDSGNETVVSANQTEFRASNWPGAANVISTKIQEASPPVTGTFGISYRNQTITGIPLESTGFDIARTIETFHGSGMVEVEREGHCAGYDWTVRFITAGGDHPLIEVDITNLNGNEISSSVTTSADGGAVYDPLPGDVLRTAHEDAQVEVVINHIISSCEGHCSYSWSEARTPNISSFSPTQGVAGSTLTITGTGFDDVTMGNNLVVIGGEDCDVTSASGTEIQCTVGEGLAGTYDVMVTVTTSGLSRDSSASQFSYQFVVDSISPLSGSNAGGTEVTVTGSGFGESVTVPIGGSECDVIASNYSTIVCVTPEGSGSVSISVENNGTTAGTQTFVYNSPSATVSSISPSAGTVGANTTVTISGSGFGGSVPAGGSVLLSGVPLEVDSWADTEILAVLPSKAPGSYTFRVYMGDEGYADVSVISDIVYTLVVHSMEPKVGSLDGGTSVTLTGEGFPAEADMAEVSVGHADCDITSLSETEIICTLIEPGETHLVSNTGSSPSFGEGYAWEPSVVDAEVGDYVSWKWTTPGLISSIDGYIIEQTATASSRSFSGGFQSSTTRTRNGGYRYQFNRPGTYYYWTGFIDTDGVISLRGRINVQERAYRPAGLQLMVDGHEAVYNVSSAGSSRRRRDVGCPEANLDCDVGNVTSSDGFTFVYADCATPKISDISVNGSNETGVTNTGTSADVITVTGSDFGSQDCQNEVYIGDSPCIVSSSSDTEINCSVDTSSDIDMGVPYLVSVYVYNIGEALNTIDLDVERTFTLLPNVEDVSPKNGSIKGGTKLNITGFGFTGPVSVVIMGTPCDVISYNSTQVECVTSESISGSGEVEVTVRTGSDQPVLATCTGSCVYSFSEDLTPVVTSFSPAVITEATTTVTINGTRLDADQASDVSVYIGDTPCTSVSLTSDGLECSLVHPVAGNSQPLSVQTLDGFADSSHAVNVSLIISSISPSSGSEQGGTYLTIAGLGFHPVNSVVNGLTCDIQAANATSLVCLTASGSGAKSVSVTVGQVTSSTETFTYSSGDTPTISAVSPTSGNSGETITLTGTNLGTDTGSVTVTIDGAECTVTAASSTAAECTLGAHSAGTFTMSVDVQPLGIATVTPQFTYDLSLTSITPSTGSFGGDQLVTIAGNGFDAVETYVEICDAECVVEGSPSATQVLCRTPAHTGSGTVACDVMVNVMNRTEDTLSAAFTYDDSVTPTVTGVSPRRGGTGGGTTVTITGSGFGTDSAAVSVTIAGSDCVISTISTTQIVCVTESHQGSVESYVRVEINDEGIAKPVDADFEYIDLWSSTWTWGGNGLPEAGDLVVIPSTMTVVLDTDTPVLKLLLIRGGKLIFDEVNVTLNAEVILITDGGLLQVGTEEEPFQHNANIIMHGHVRSKELPIYGTKTLAVREGTLDLHGKPVGISWTRLEATANAGDSTIQLESAVEWPVGSEIAIASTGDMTSMPQNEKRTITAVSGDGLTLTLNTPLEYQHLGETVDITSGVTVEARAEVGLLSRNIVVRGSDDSQWHDEIEACKAGFNTGEFATQTCFQGRFGEEIGNDQYGSQIMFHAPRPNECLVTGRIENVEITYAGQAFRLGRYAIHFHLNGNMNGSYVRSCGIHKSFNRAVNIHGTHEVLVEHTVIYDIMGGAFFFEDGIETGNIWQYNLAIFVRSSSSLQNADITPAAFWVTNPNNTIRHNAAAGGSHFGFWYRLNAHPEGPSHDSSYCIKHVELGEFYNNSAHSLGWFGLWIFENYYPKQGGTLEGGTCQSSVPAPAVFDGLVTWNTEKGAESTGSGSVQFKNFVMVNNKITGIEVKNLGHHPQDYGDDAPMVLDSVIAAEAGVLNDQPSSFGITLPLARGFRVKSTTFVNYDSEQQGVFDIAGITGKSGADNGGFTYWIEDITYDNSPYRAYFRWIFEGVLHDVDGTTSGITGGNIVPTMNTLPIPDCSQETGFSGNPSFPGSACSSDIVFHRFSWNNPEPSSLDGRKVVLTNRFGSDTGTFQKKRMTHPFGWMVLLVNGEVTDMYFENSQHITNISFTGKMYDFEGDEHVIITQNLTQSPDMFTIAGDFRDEHETALAYQTSFYGDWTFDDDGKIFSYIVSGRDENNLAGPATYIDRAVNLRVYQCYFLNCIVPVGGGTGTNPTARPADAKFWSDTESWSTMEEGWGGNYGNGNYGLPLAGDEIHIPTGIWMVLDVEDLPRFSKIYITGVLEFEYLPKDDGSYYDLSLETDNILIMGGRLIIGTEEDPFMGNAELILRGNHNSEEMLLNYGPVVGAKAMGVFGGLDMHGVNTTLSWTRLERTVLAGSNSIDLSDPVDWIVGSEILVTTTGMSPYEGETKTITAKSADNTTLTLDSPLAHNHLAVTHTVNGNTIRMSAEVGLLSRNVKIVGHEHSRMFSELFGARVIVGSMLDDDGNPHKGYARLSNVQFYRCGQEGHTESYDPRYALSFLNLASVPPGTSYVRECSFHWNFSPAIGIFGTQNLPVDSNVIYHTIGSSIIAEGSRHILSRNLISEVYFPGTYDGRREVMKFTWDAGIQINKADGHIAMYDNIVAGSERAAYHTDGQLCSEVEGDSSLFWTNNEAHSVLIGVGLYPLLEADGVQPCLYLNGFKVWKAFDYGIYSNTKSDTKITDYVSVDNGVGAFVIVMGPSATGHNYKDHTVEISDSLFVGTSEAFDCTTDVLGNTPNMQVSVQGRGWRTESGGKVGLSFSNFNSGSNKAVTKTFKNTMSYQALRGITLVSDTTFAEFDTSCGSRKDYAITTNPNNDDFQHPVHLSSITLSNVNNDNKVWFHRPNLGKINPADCVDMDCDAFKKAILKDTDGSFLGTAGAAVVPESEWEWDGDPRRGLGDYRIPRTMLTDLDGNRLEVDSIAPHLGVHRDSSCSFNSNFQAYQCAGPDYLNAQLESLDWDTETRRLSPVALLSDEGYLDLVNGPQDHGWCSGYTCQKRLSTFPLLVAAGHDYLVHYTGSSPQDSRIHLLNADDTQAVVFSIWYSQPWRLDVSVGGRYVMPTNGYYDNENRLLFSPPVADEFMPDTSADPSGTNYFDRAEGILNVLVRGSEPVTIVTSDLILVTFDMPTLTVDEFFGENIINNLAAFYDIPANKIRIADAVRETRRKRREGTVTITIEIAELPTNGTDEGVPSNSSLAQLSESIVNAYQMGLLGDIIGVEILSMSIIEPPPDTSSDTWYSMADDGELSVSVTLLVPDQMELVNEVVPSGAGLDFTVHPELRMLDSTGAVLTQVGSLLDPWQVQVTLMTGAGSHADATLMGTTTQGFPYGGVVSFADLAISHSGDYALRFEVVSPTEAGSFRVETEFFTVEELDLMATFINLTDPFVVDQTFSLTAQIASADTEEPIDDISWQGHTWSCTISKSEICNGDVTFVSGATAEVDVPQNAVDFDIIADSAGMCPLVFTFTSDPDDLSFTYTKSFMIYPQNHVTPHVEITKDVVIRFDADFSSHGAGYEEQIKAAVFNTFWPMYPNTTWSNFSVYEGSIVVSFTVGGQTEDVENLLAMIKVEVAGPLVLVYGGPSSISSFGEMDVDGEIYNDSEGLSTAELVGIIVATVLFICIAIVIIIVIVKCNKAKGGNFTKDKEFSGGVKGRRYSTMAAPLDSMSIPTEHPLIREEDEESSSSSDPDLHGKPRMRGDSLFLAGAVPPSATYLEEKHHQRRSPFASRQVSPLQGPRYDLPRGIEPARELTSDDLYGTRNTLTPDSALHGRSSPAGGRASPRLHNRVSPLSRTVTDLTDKSLVSPSIPIAFDGHIDPN